VKGGLISTTTDRVNVLLKMTPILTTRFWTSRYYLNSRKKKDTEDEAVNIQHSNSIQQTLKIEIASTSGRMTAIF